MSQVQLPTQETLNKAKSQSHSPTSSPPSTQPPGDGPASRLVSRTLGTAPGVTHPQHSPTSAQGLVQLAGKGPRAQDGGPLGVLWPAPHQCPCTPFPTSLWGCDPSMEQAPREPSCRPPTSRKYRGRMVDFVGRETTRWGWGQGTRGPPRPFACGCKSKLGPSGQGVRCSPAAWLCRSRKGPKGLHNEPRALGGPATLGGL